MTEGYSLRDLAINFGQVEYQVALIDRRLRTWVRVSQVIFYGTTFSGALVLGWQAGMMLP